MNIRSFMPQFLAATAFAVAMFVGATDASAQQTPGGAVEAHHHLAAMHHAHAMDHLSALHHHAAAHAASNTAVDREVVTEHARAAGEHLDAARRHQQAEEQAMTPAERTAHRANLDTIHAAHAEAARHHQALTAEVARPTPDPHVVAQHSAAMFHAVRRAQDAHQTIGHSIGVHDHGAPPAQPAAAASAAPAAVHH